MHIREGYMPFLHYQTYYRIVGEQTAHKKPLLLLHGGPGSAHDYFEVLDWLAEADGRQLIMYDQLGCGKSWVDNRPDLWCAETWLAELIALRKHLALDELHILGQSWGGMLLLDYVCNYQPAGVQSLILSSTLPASRMWAAEQQRLIQALPAPMQRAITQAVASGNYTDPAYLDALAEYMRRHASKPAASDAPECLRRAVRKGAQAYRIAWGPNEFTPQGTLKDYDVCGQLGDIRQPALIISGGNDLCTPYIAKYMYDRITHSRWELFRDCRHSCFVEENAAYVALLREWLNRYDQL